jgi:hypothetical protein
MDEITEGQSHDVMHDSNERHLMEVGAEVEGSRTAG